MLSLLESSRLPRLPTGSWDYRGQLRKSKRWRPAQAADVRDTGPGPERAQPGGFQSRILLSGGHLFVHHPRTGRADRGAQHWGPQSPASLGLGNITAFQCRSHFKLISLCIMFFKSFLNKTKIQSVLFPWDMGTRIRFWEWPSEASGRRGTRGFGVSGNCPMHLISQPSNHVSSLQKAGPGGPVLLGFLEHSLLTEIQDDRATSLRRSMGRVTMARSSLKPRHMAP